ncbi:hypothetical protein [Mucilaginibacter sp.]
MPVNLGFSVLAIEKNYQILGDKRSMTNQFNHFLKAYQTAI